MIFASIILVCLPTAFAQVVHYPPSSSRVNNLTYALSGTDAPGIYNSSLTPNAKYGTYNWCNMPHVRKKEYKWVSTFLYHKTNISISPRFPELLQRIISSNTSRSFRDIISVLPMRQIYSSKKMCSGLALVRVQLLVPSGMWLSYSNRVLLPTKACSSEGEGKKVSPVRWQAFTDVENPWTLTQGSGFVDSA